MSENNSMYAVSVNSEKVMAPSLAAAEAIAAALGGSVVTLSRKEALASVREATKVPEYPPVLGHMLADVKATILREIDANNLLADSCWRVILQYDASHDAWYTEVKNLAAGPTVYNQVTGEKYASVCHARWSHGKTCDVKYLSNGISEDKFGKANPTT